MMFYRKTIRRLKQDIEAAYDGRTGQARATAGNVDKDRRPRPAREAPAAGRAVQRGAYAALKYAAAIALALALAAGGGRLLGGGGDGGGTSGAAAAFDFQVVAYADPLGGEPVSLELSDADVTLPSGRLSQGTEFHGGVNGYAYNALWEVGSLKVVGEGIESVTYTAGTGSFANCDSFMVHPVAQANNYIRCFAIDEDTYNEVEAITGGYDTTPRFDFIDDFLAYLESGAIDHVIGRELREHYCETYDQDRTHFRLRQLSGSNDWWPWPYDDTKPDEAVQLRYELWYYDASAEIDLCALVFKTDENGLLYFDPAAADEYDPTAYWELGSSVTVGAGEGVNYCPGYWVFDHVVNAQGGVDYPSLGSDTVTITVTTTSGEVYTKTVLLSFDQDGNLCARLAD
jgi:hypothetical protein